MTFAFILIVCLLCICIYEYVLIKKYEETIKFRNGEIELLRHNLNLAYKKYLGEVNYNKEQ